MKKITALVILALGVTASTLWQTAAAQTVEVMPQPNFAPHMQALRQQRLQAADASDELMANLAKIKSFSANYQQKVFDIQQKLLQEGKGTLALQQHARFRFESETPEPSLLVSDGTTLWFYNELLEQVSIYNAASEVGQTPFALLTSRDTALWQQYQITKSEQESDVSRFYIHPFDPNNPVQQLMLTFNADSLTEMQVIDINQQQSVYQFYNAALNSRLSDALFTFEIANHLDVDDQRQR